MENISTDSFVVEVANKFKKMTCNFVMEMLLFFYYLIQYNIRNNLWLIIIVDKIFIFSEGWWMYIITYILKNRRLYNKKKLINMYMVD